MTRRTVHHALIVALVMRWIILVAFAAACAGQEPGRQAGATDTDTGGTDMISEADARRRAEAFVAQEWNQYGPAQPYTLAFESVNLHEDVYQVQFRKLFREPTKASPPYRLVLVSPDGTVRWGNP
jgi:hypothetical protein